MNQLFMRGNNIDIKEPFTFEQYVEWAFQFNNGTFIQNIQNVSLYQTNCFTTQIKDDQIKDQIWLFRKCQKLSDLDRQNDAFLGHKHIIRHIFLFLLIIIRRANKRKNEDQIEYDKKRRAIYTLMNATSIFFENDKLNLYVSDPSLEILKQTYDRKDIQLVGDQIGTYFIEIIDIWKQLKDTDIEFTKPQSDIEFLDDFGRIHCCLNMEKTNQLRELQKQKDKEKIIAQQKQQQEKLYLSALRKEVPYSIKFSKIIDLKNGGAQSLFLQPNGNLIQGKIWFPKNDLHLCPLWVSNKYFITSLNTQNNLNQELKSHNGFIKYQGPVNDYFEPQTYGYDQENEGVMTTISSPEIISKGGFKHGLFEGRNRIYTNSTLTFYGGFKNGVKHGEGYELYPSSQFYMKGVYEYNLKQGLFVDYKCVNFQVRDKEFRKIGSILEYYRNGEKFRQIPGDISLIQQINQNPACSFLNFDSYGINNFQLASLRPGGWINSSVIDILLQQLTNLVSQINKTYQGDFNQRSKTIFFNCSEFQDMFGSMTTQNDSINEQTFKDKLKQQNVEQKDIRIVFYLNLDRSHFLSVVYENEKLHIIDSLKDSRKPLKFQIRCLLSKNNFNIKEDIDNINLSQQQNSYDCGVYTIYYVSQFIKYQHLTIEEMIKKNCFLISQSKINYLRYLIYQNIMGNGATIMEL